VRAGIAAEGKLDTPNSSALLYHCHAASAAPSRGPRHTDACAAIRTVLTTYNMLLTIGIGSGQRQLIAVTCIAEHA